jgi:hypothetical protein
MAACGAKRTLPRPSRAIASPFGQTNPQRNFALSRDQAAESTIEKKSLWPDRRRRIRLRATQAWQSTEGEAFLVR